MNLCEFINASPTAFHCVDTVCTNLKENGYTELLEKEAFFLEYGKSYFVKRNGSSVIAFSIPAKEAKGFHVFSTHSDSPSFRIKENCEMVFEDNYVRLNVEKYGGMIMSSWYDRPLSVAGRVIVREKDELVEKLVNVDKDLCVIPNVAIHMRGDINTGYSYSVQSDLLPLIGCFDSKNTFEDIISDAAGVPKEAILGKDLLLYARQQGIVAGAKDELILCPRLDDQACVYAGLEGLLQSKGGNFIKVLAVFDNEEVGSGTKQGADSTFLDDILYRISKALNIKRADYLRLIDESFNLSADNAHAVHPALAAKADPKLRPYLNKGIVIKFNGNQRYATDAYSAAYVRMLANDNGIPVQVYANNSDIAGGSTLGNISTSHVSMKTADIGLAQLAMHSAVETMGSQDVEHMINLSKAFFEA